MNKTYLNIKHKIKKIAGYHFTCLLSVAFICTCSTLLSLLLNDLGIHKENLLMIFLVGVLLSTVFVKGYTYGLITSVISVFLFNFFFTEPLHTFVITNKQDVLLMVFFLIAALICGTMSSKSRQQAEIAKENERNAQLMYEITESFLNIVDTEAIINNGINYIYTHTGCPCKVVLDSSRLDNNKKLFYSLDYPMDSEEEKRFISFSIKGLASELGTITIAQSEECLLGDSEKIIRTIVYQMALVLDREFINTEREKIKLDMESEHLKSTLLRSVSHDIRTPLTGILGASSLILDNYEDLDDDAIKRLAADINEESSWLIKTVQNILDMTRINSGKLSIKKEYEAVDDLINEAVLRVPLLTKTNRLRVTMPKYIVLVKVDGKLIVQVLINLLDNAYKHAGENSLVELKSYTERGKIVFQVSDNGCGIDESIIGSLFEGFVTLPRNTSDKGRGVGLGLSICKAIADAHDGEITAYNNAEGGASFKLILPYEEV